MKERLIELIGKSLNKHIGKSCLLAENIANDLLENGVIVPPCKVGDDVYYINSSYEKQGRRNVRIDFVEKGKVDNIIIGGLGIPQIDVCNAKNQWTMFDSEADFGRTVFLTKEEAQKALGGVEG